MKAGLLQLQVGRRVVLRRGHPKVVEEGQILVLPRITNPETKISGCRGQGPHVDAQRQQDVFEWEPGGAVSKT